ncbi:MAG: hypothetical protein JO359_11130 [Candidatus Eremiobacteraeota bacterium]|nr:hypothetical protein [Candidatus Eremiobacteraeota bacterium]
MKRGLFVMLLTLSTSLIAATAPALADGSLTIKNATVAQPVTVEVRAGATVADSVPLGNAVLNKGESVTLDPTNLQFFWRRQVDPSKGDSQWTDWERVDPRSGNQSVQF